MTVDADAPEPDRVDVTDVWLAESRARNAAYEEERRRHMQAWFRRGEPDETEPDDPAPTASGRNRKPSRGRIHDKRQDSLDL